MDLNSNEIDAYFAVEHDSGEELFRVQEKAVSASAQILQIED